jgi:hypothetical protein
MFRTFVQNSSDYLFYGIRPLHNNGNVSVIMFSCSNNYQNVFSMAQYHSNILHVTCLNDKQDMHSSLLTLDNNVWYDIVHASTIINFCFEMHLYGFIVEPNNDIAWIKT